MVAFKSLTLFGLLPALALAARQLPETHAVARHAAGPAPAFVHEGVRRSRTHTIRRGRHGKQCRVKHHVEAAPAEDASTEDAPADESSEWSESSTEETPSEDAPAEETSSEDTSTGEWSETPAEDGGDQPASDEWSEQPASEEWSEQPAEETSEQPVYTPSFEDSTVSAWANHDSTLQVTDGNCGSSGSSADEPNGSEAWINCGLESGGWTPPMVTVDQLNAQPLTADGPFAACVDYFGYFETYGAQNGIPPIMLASIALQESTCRPDVTGGNGEAGLMQLMYFHCGEAPGGNCYDVDFNIRKGASYLKQVLDQNGGNIFTALGSYNGWFPGMTAGQVYAEPNCAAQQNLDYVYQMVNGWMQGKQGYEIGKYHNRAACGM